MFRVCILKSTAGGFTGGRGGIKAFHVWQLYPTSTKMVDSKHKLLLYSSVAITMRIRVRVRDSVRTAGLGSKDHL